MFFSCHKRTILFLFFRNEHFPHCTPFYYCPLCRKINSSGWVRPLILGIVRAMSKQCNTLPLNNPISNPDSFLLTPNSCWSGDFSFFWRNPRLISLVYTRGSREIMKKVQRTSNFVLGSKFQIVSSRFRLCPSENFPDDSGFGDGGVGVGVQGSRRRVGWQIFFNFLFFIFDTSSDFSNFGLQSYEQ